MSKQISKIKLALLLLPGVGYIVLFMSVVVYMIFAQSFGGATYATEAEFSLKHWQETLGNELTWRFFFYSFRQGLLSAFGAVLLAYPIALWLRKSFRGSTLMTGLLRIPMLIPGLVAAFLFLNIIAYHGLLNQLLMFLGFIKEPLRMQNDKYGIGIIVLQIWKNMPFALLLLTGTMRGISSEVIDAARDLGANKIMLLWRIIFPLTLSTMRVVLIIIFIGALGDFSFNAVAGPRNLQSLSQYMITLTHQLLEVNNAAVIAILLMLASLIGVIIISYVTKIFDVRKEM